MRVYTDLTDQEKEEAVQAALQLLLSALLQGGIRFNDELNHDDLQERIDAAVAKAEAMQTPWFAGEYVMEAVGEELTAMARCDAEDAFYPARGERIIHL